MFDETQQPLDASGVWNDVPETGVVVSFLRRIQRRLELNDACLVIGLILLERVSLTTGRQVLHARTWRRSLLMSLVIASKSVYDERVLLTDFTKELAPYLTLTLKTLQQQERYFLGLLDYATVVYRRQYAQYYFALLDVAEAAGRQPPLSQGSSSD
jgi:hypothetical protein